MGARSRKNVQLALTESPWSSLIEAVLTVGVFSFVSMLYEVRDCISSPTCWQSTHPSFCRTNWMSQWKRAGLYGIVKGKHSVRASFTLSCVVALFSHFITCHFLIQLMGSHVTVHLISERLILVAQKIISQVRFSGFSQYWLVYFS